MRAEDSHIPEPWLGARGLCGAQPTPERLVVPELASCTECRARYRRFAQGAAVPELVA